MEMKKNVETYFCTIWTLRPGNIPLDYTMKTGPSEWLQLTVNSKIATYVDGWKIPESTHVTLKSALNEG